MAVETEDVANVAKETVYGSSGKQVVAVNKVQGSLTIMSQD